AEDVVGVRLHREHAHGLVAHAEHLVAVAGIEHLDAHGFHGQQLDVPHDAGVLTRVEAVPHIGEARDEAAREGAGAAGGAAHVARHRVLRAAAAGAYGEGDRIGAFVVGRGIGDVTALHGPGVAHVRV